MEPTNCNIRVIPELTKRHPFCNAASIGLAGIIGSLFSGCSHNPEVIGAALPDVKPIYITRSADTVDGYYALGKYYYWQNRFDKAQEAFEKALKLQVDSVDALNALGVVYDRLGQFEAAQRSYRLALRTAPEAAYIWANLGYSLLLEGQPVMAAAMYEKALTLDPANDIARRQLALATEQAAKSAASAPATGQELPVVASAAPVLKESDAAGSKSRPSILTEGSKPAGASIVSIVPHENVTHSNVIQTVSTVGNASPDLVQPKQPATAVARNDVSITYPIAMATRAVQPPAHDRVHASSASPVLDEATAPARARVEISNGNGVNGMARALKSVMKAEGVNVTRVTNALPFNKSRTIIICSNETIEAAKTITRLLPGKPSVAIGSTAYRNVEIRVVLGADAALAWNNSKRINLTALGQ